MFQSKINKCFESLIFIYLFTNVFCLEIQKDCSHDEIEGSEIQMMN